MLEERLKIKPLSKSQILISLDRLTRFKPTEDKYLRVFKEIIISNLIYPTYKKKELDLIDYSVLVNIVEKIFNFSLNVFNQEPCNDFLINKKLFEYERKVFKFNKNVEMLLDNKINYVGALKLFEEKDLPLNLKWMKSLLQDENQIKNRANFGLKFPLEKIILVEGITEEILLPKFALISGIDFNKSGIHILSAGGKKQVVKLFYQYADILKLPMFVLLDNDAKSNFEEIHPKLRKGDSVIVLKSGEFEDILPLGLIKRTLNKIFEYKQIKISDLKKSEPMTKILEELFKERGLEFRKSEFASLIRKNIFTARDISAEIKSVIQNMV